MAYSATAVERRVVESRWLADRWTNLASSRTLKSSKNAARRGAVQQQKQQQQQQVEEVHQGSWQLAWGERERGAVVTDSC